MIRSLPFDDDDRWILREDLRGMILIGGSGDVPDIDAFKKRTCF
jgi:hypothetical protein